jgi:hypothetical protein
MDIISRKDGCFLVTTPDDDMLLEDRAVSNGRKTVRIPFHDMHEASTCLQFVLRDLGDGTYQISKRSWGARVLPGSGCDAARDTKTGPLNDGSDTLMTWIADHMRSMQERVLKHIYDRYVLWHQGHRMVRRRGFRAVSLEHDIAKYRSMLLVGTSEVIEGEMSIHQRLGEQGWPLPSKPWVVWTCASLDEVIALWASAPGPSHHPLGRRVALTHL